MNTLGSHSNRLQQLLTLSCGLERGAEGVLIEVSLLSRVAVIGTVPSTWRLIVSPLDDGVWKITSIDTVEIMARLYR